jgi:hypothetical protein
MGRLFRRVVRTARGPRRVKRAPAVRGADGRQYRVVAVDENENNEFADPPRKWGRVGVMAGAWALALALGAWVAPGFAASGNPENGDPRDEAATSANNAAWRYLRYGSIEEIDRAEATLCEGASPEVSPHDLEAIRGSYSEELGGISRVDLETAEPVLAPQGTTVAGTVVYIYQGAQRYEDFIVTVKEHDGSFCVSNAVQVQDDEPSTEAPSGDVVDSQTLATDFLRSVVVNRDPLASTALQCDSYTGITAQELDAAITAWAATNGATSGYLNSVEPETSETSITAFSSEVVLQGGLNQESFVFEVGVQGDCIASLEGGEDLMEPSGN